MALLKQIELENGIIINYHRITSLNKVTNVSNTIEISSYTSEEQRLKELDYQKLQLKNISENGNISEEEKEKLKKGIDVYISTDFIELSYDPEIGIKDAYAYLKTTEKFKGSEDI